MSDLLRTPLYDFHVANGGRMVPFAGWEMPVQYTGIIDEHEAVRNVAGLFDVSHMGEATVVGPQATAFLDYVCTNSISNLKNGQARYTIICQPDGDCVDDVIVYRNDDNDFFICLNASNTAKDIEWLLKQAKKFDCEVKDVSDQYAQLALQGPKSPNILQALTSYDLEELEYFHFVSARVADMAVMIARTGYTGERGYEIYMAPNKAEHIAKAILEKGAEHGLKLAGLGCRDSLRLEMGYPLYGHEISDSISPLEAGLGWAVKLKKESNFIGKDTLTLQKANGLQRKVVYFKLNDRRIAREGTEIVDGSGTKVGCVLSGTHSPSAGCPIGSALVDLSGGELPGKLAVRIRNKDYACELVKPPFVQTTT